MINRFALFVFALASLTFACGSGEQDKSTESKEANTEEVKQELTLSPANTELSFKAFKTTDKLPVGGVFKTVNFEERSANDVETLLDGLEFSIPVSSLFTNDATGTRDPKILKFFFGVMTNTEMLSGTINSKNGNYSATITMNGETNSLPLTVDVSQDSKLVANGTVNLADWKALDALASLNEACFDLHKGSDKVSKTWEDVDVQITASLK